jgi:hypothetical protein
LYGEDIDIDMDSGGGGYIDHVWGLWDSECTVGAHEDVGVAESDVPARFPIIQVPCTDLPEERDTIGSDDAAVVSIAVNCLEMVSKEPKVDPAWHLGNGRPRQKARAGGPWRFGPRKTRAKAMSKFLEQGATEKANRKNNHRTYVLFLGAGRCFVVVALRQNPVQTHPSGQGARGGRKTNKKETTYHFVSFF